MDIKFKEKLPQKAIKKAMENRTSSAPNKVGVAEFAGCLMTIANVLHKHHLKVTGVGSYASHVALNELYDSLPSHADSLVELYQGYYGELVEAYDSMSEAQYLKMSPLEVVTWLLKYVEEYRTIFTTNSMLQNQVDELIADIAKTKYKIQFLS